MVWVALVVILGVLVGLLIINFGYRRSVLATLAVLLVIVGAALLYTQVQDSVKQGRIPVSEVRFEDFSMQPAYGDSYRMNARVHNMSSDRTLHYFGLTITAADCLAQQGQQQCLVVGEQSKEIRVEVPPRQARDITDQFAFGRIRARGELQWDHEITYTGAR